MPSSDSQRYTTRARKNKSRDLFRDPLSSRLRRGFEGVTRSMLYGLLRGLFHNRPLKGKIPLQDIGSILIIPYGDAIGDLIAATPIWHAIKRRAPQCRTGVFTSPRNESLVQGNPEIDETYSFSGRRNLKQWRELMRARKARYDVLLNIHLTHQTDYGIFANLIAPTGVKITGGHPRRSLYSIFFNHIGQRDRRTTNLPLYSLDLLAEAVAFEPPLMLSDCWPILPLPNRAITAVDARTKDFGDFIILHLQAATPFREWGIDNSIQLAHRLVHEMPKITILITVSPPFLSQIEHRIVSEEDPRIRTFQTDDLMELAALIGRARVVVSPETSIPHFASAMQTPVVVLLPDREQLPIVWLPVATPSRLLAPAMRGEPVATISVDEVLEAVRSLLDGTWHITQTGLTMHVAPDVMFQRSNGAQPLTKFLLEPSAS